MNRVWPLALAITILSTVPTFGQELESGFYKMSLPASYKAAPIFVFVENKGDVVSGVELTTKAQISGTKEPGSDVVEVPMIVSTSGVTAARLPSTTGHLRNAQLKTAREGWVVASMVKIKTVWQCGNHAPLHIAESAAQIKALSSEHQCEKWSPVPDK